MRRMGSSTAHPPHGTPARDRRAQRDAGLGLEVTPSTGQSERQTSTGDASKRVARLARALATMAPESREPEAPRKRSCKDENILTRKKTQNCKSLRGAFWRGLLEGPSGGAFGGAFSHAGRCAGAAARRLQEKKLRKLDLDHRER